MRKQRKGGFGGGNWGGLEDNKDDNELQKLLNRTKEVSDRTEETIIQREQEKKKEGRCGCF